MAKRDRDKVDQLIARSKAQSVMSAQGLDSQVARELVIDLRVDLAKRLGHFPPFWSDEKVLLVMHKFRYEMKDAPADRRHESRAWLVARGFHRFRMQPWPAEGDLP